MLDLILWALTELVMAPVNIVRALLNAGSWLDWSNFENLARFIYYGASVELFFALFFIFGTITVIGMFKREFLWTCVRIQETFANAVGRTAAWVGLLMVLQQVMIVFLQRIFRVPDISMGPLGTVFTQDLSWWAEELKLYNAIVVTLCVTYTFVQGGHVRVDLVYSAVKFRTKKVLDMFGAVFFMLPVVTLTYMYAWFFMWRHLVVPNPSASSELDRMIMQARAMRWNVETIGFSPNGFNAYFLFKVLIVAYCVLVFLQAWSMFWRSYLEWKEGEASEAKYLDRDKLGDEDAERAAAIH
ncbi:TRAP transporter small permease subunit [Jannaschia sp. CCS1]|uniref:TRAP transporter small permease subunit n=1 Tax=Jannaschia sp. (strain CCS1) TaxID=290400 RepID=UPI000053D4EE|nr:TRAP transporter small permease subunit [Jannaschia sp. CCS1]ABD54817.1 TRAP-type mannitol/chloroaromatic compound transport system small permease component-like protein [Jannaschia sp. CCS1]